MKKRVICLYRVSTIGQVDHDDIPMQKLACREYAATHPDWEIVDEISEKGISGYEISTNERDAIVEIKKRAALHQFDVLLVFMFDRLGRREDETPFVVQWFVQQGIEVWSTREGEQRFDTHVDKLLNYIRFWQASGESEKTAIRVRTKHEQMVMDGQWRGGYLAYGYRLEFLGRTNKKNQPVRDLVIDEDEAKVVKEIFRLLSEEGYGTNRVANHLNEKGIKTKRGTSLWRGTSIRALIANPIYKGILHFGDELSEPMESLRIIDDKTFDRCQEIVISSRKSCSCPSGYEMPPLNEAVENEIREFFRNLGSIPTEQLVERACDRNEDILRVAYQQAVSEFEKTQKQVSALEAETVKVLTGESQLNLAIVNGMLLKLRDKLEEEANTVEEAKNQLDDAEKTRKATEAQVDQLLTWAEKCDSCSFEAKHLIIAALVDRIEANKNYEIKVFFKVSAEQFLGRVTRIA